MLSKRALPTELINADPSKRLRINLADLFLSNDVSGSRAQSLFADGVLAGADHCRDLGKAGNFGRQPRHHQKVAQEEAVAIALLCESAPLE